eukprot:COSAG02_NODE_52183_length_309_cov_0.976190_1_plen_21_part_01
MLANRCGMHANRGGSCGAGSA